MRRGLAALAWLLIAASASAQAELFAVARSGTIVEVMDAIRVYPDDPTRLVDQFGQDLLVYAATENPEPEVIRYLVGIGFPVNQTTPAGWTPLMYAVRFNPEPLIAVTLIELGGSITHRNFTGQLALHLVPENPNSAYASHPVVTLLTPVAAPAGIAKPRQVGRDCGSSVLDPIHRSKGPQLATATSRQQEAVERDDAGPSHVAGRPRTRKSIVTMHRAAPLDRERDPASHDGHLLGGKPPPVNQLPPMIVVTPLLAGMTGPYWSGRP